MSQTQQFVEEQEVVVFYPSGLTKNGTFCGYNSHGCAILFDDDTADPKVPERYIKDRAAGLFTVRSLGCDK